MEPAGAERHRRQSREGSGKRGGSRANQHVRAGAARVDGNAARVAGASAGARVINVLIVEVSGGSWSYFAKCGHETVTQPGNWRERGSASDQRVHR